VQPEETSHLQLALRWRTHSLRIK